MPPKAEKDLQAVKRQRRDARDIFVLAEVERAADHEETATPLTDIVGEKRLKECYHDLPRRDKIMAIVKPRGITQDDVTDAWVRRRAREGAEGRPFLYFLHFDAPGSARLPSSFLSLCAPFS